MAELLSCAEEKNCQHEPCPMTSFIGLISGKWAIPIIYRLIVINEPVRFGDLLRAAAPITQKELTKQLRLFEQRGLVTRTVYPEIPPRVEYQITALGLTLQNALAPLAAWMREYGQQLKH